MRKTILPIIASAIMGCSSLTNVNISPIDPSTTDALECKVEGEGLYDYYWYRDGKYYGEEIDVNASYIDSSLTSVGDAWYCEAFLSVSPNAPYYVGNDGVTIEP